MIGQSSTQAVRSGEVRHSYIAGLKVVGLVLSALLSGASTWFGLMAYAFGGWTWAGLTVMAFPSFAIALWRRRLGLSLFWAMTSILFVTELRPFQIIWLPVVMNAVLLHFATHRQIPTSPASS